MNQFVESLKRLYDNHIIKDDKVIKLFESGKITDAEKAYILEK